MGKNGVHTGENKALNGENGALEGENGAPSTDDNHERGRSTVSICDSAVGLTQAIKLVLQTPPSACVGLPWERVL